LRLLSGYPSILVEFRCIGAGQQEIVFCEGSRPASRHAALRGDFRQVENFPSRVLGLAYRGVREKMFTVIGRRTMSKGMDKRKEAKKKPAKSLQEKRAAKREKKQSRGFQF
jgi:hypothetical protein